MKNKELLNSIYGMSCQKPTKALILFNGGSYDLDMSFTQEELLTKSKKRAFITYQFACWTTSHARAALEEGIKLCGDELLYVDTDSCKFIGNKDFSNYNRVQRELSKQSGLFATDRKGVEHYGGVYEFDGSFTAFCTHGAKKYAYLDTDGKLHLTLSGVSKKKGESELLKYGGIEAFQDGFIFHNCGKTASVYNDIPFGKYEVEGREIEITKNVVIEEKNYTLSKTIEYSEIIKQSKKFLYKDMEILKNTFYKSYEK